MKFLTISTKVEWAINEFTKAKSNYVIIRYITLISDILYYHCN